MTHIPDEKGWIEWNGGECPVEPGTLVEAICRDGWHFDIRSAASLGGKTVSDDLWRYSGGPTDIIAYRIVQP